MRVAIDEAERLLADAAAKFTPRNEAAYFADLVVESHLRRSPRLNPIEEALSDLKVWRNAGEETRRNGYRVLSDRGGVLLLDFHGLAPGVKIEKVHAELEARCGDSGIAAAGFRNSSGIITLLPWALGLARRDLIGIAMFSGGAGCCVPFGGTVGLFGTLPLAYAVPTDGDPIVADMAMTEIPFLEVKQAKEDRTPLREGVAVDGNGAPTRIAASALSDDGTANLLPIGGGFKGYALAILVEILTGSLVRSPLSDKKTAGWNPTEYGALLLAIDIGAFADSEVFKHDTRSLVEAIRAQRPATGMDAVPIPGDRGLAQMQARRDERSIEVDAALHEELAGLAR